MKTNSSVHVLPVYYRHKSLFKKVQVKKCRFLPSIFGEKYAGRTGIIVDVRWHKLTEQEVFTVLFDSLTDEAPNELHVYFINSLDFV